MKFTKLRLKTEVELFFILDVCDRLIRGAVCEARKVYLFALVHLRGHSNLHWVRHR